MIDENDIAQLKSRIAATGFSTGELVRAAWAPASTYRKTDMRGGANGARVGLDPQRSWEVNDPAELKKVLAAYQRIQTSFNKGRTDGKQVSMADLIVLGATPPSNRRTQRAGK